MNKLAARYLILTFAIMAICWGTLALLSVNGIALKENWPLFVPYLIGGFSPTIASFVALRKNQGVTFKEWIKTIFAFKSSWAAYLLVFVFAAVYITPLALICGYQNGAPLWAIFAMVPIMIIGGGLEEAGWRYVLFPELEKKIGWIFSALLVALVWWLWHFPLFFINGLPQYGQNYFAFGLNVLGLSFALAAVKKISGNVWLCVLLHSLVNSLMGIFVVEERILGNAVSAAALLLLAVALVEWGRRRQGT